MYCILYKWFLTIVNEPLNVACIVIFKRDLSKSYSFQNVKSFFPIFGLNMVLLLSKSNILFNTIALDDSPNTIGVYGSKIIQIFLYNLKHNQPDSVLGMPKSDSPISMSCSVSPSSASVSSSWMKFSQKGEGAGDVHTNTTWSRNTKTTTVRIVCYHHRVMITQYICEWVNR